jgi:hypothetical protein
MAVHGRKKAAGIPNVGSMPTAPLGAFGRPAETATA